MKIIDNFNFKGLRAIVRVDFNVPLDKKTREVTDDTRSWVGKDVRLHLLERDLALLDLELMAQARSLVGRLQRAPVVEGGGRDPR